MAGLDPAIQGYTQWLQRSRQRWRFGNLEQFVNEVLVTLWRPTGSKELALVEQSGWRAIFYPVTNRDYAEQIARDWNTKFDDKIGHVTRFEVRKAYLDGFEKQVVGGGVHEEYWIPAERLSEFNANIVGLIKVVASYTEKDRIEFETKVKPNA
jgi:hypothetical protein